MNQIAVLVMCLFATKIDLEQEIIPDSITLCGMLGGIIMSTVIPGIHDATSNVQGLFSSIGDGILTIFIMLCYASLCDMVLHKNTIGGGDIKLMGAIATMVNFKITAIVLILAPVFALIHFAIKRFKQEIFSIPYAPSIMISLIISIVWSDKIIGFLL